MNFKGLGSLLAFLIVSLILMATPANAALPKSSAEDFLSGYNACLAATDDRSISPQKLEELGWKRATMHSDDGKEIAIPLMIFGHSDFAPLIYLHHGKDSASGSCMVMARTKNRRVIDEFKATFGDTLPEPNADGQIITRKQGRILLIAPSNTRSKSTLRLIVSTPIESK